MKYGKLGSTGLKVSKIGFGGSPIGTVPMQQAQATLKGAVKLGINLFDTHSDYDQSEIWMAWLRTQETVQVSTKTRAYFTEARMKQDYDRSMRQFGRIEIYMFSNVDTMECYQRMRDMLPYFLELKNKRSIKALGITGHHPSYLERALADGLPLDVFLFPYNTMRTDCGVLFEPLRKAGKGIMLMKPFNAGEDGAWDKFTVDDFIAFYAYKEHLFDCLLMGMKTVEEVETDLALVEKLWGWSK